MTGTGDRPRAATSRDRATTARARPATSRTARATVDLAPVIPLRSGDGSPRPNPGRTAADGSDVPGDRTPPGKAAGQADGRIAPTATSRTASRTAGRTSAEDTGRAAPTAAGRTASKAAGRTAGTGAGKAEQPTPTVVPAAAPEATAPAAWETKLASALAFLQRRVTGDYEVDEFGFDPDLTVHLAVPALRPLYEKWFRTEVHGVENLPAEGGALLVANHAGAIWALDGVMTALAVHDSTPGHRYLRMLGADLVFSTPVLGPVARKTGSTLACQPDAERLLSKGELVGVWPEGYKGIGKPFRERYKLQRFGRGGFVTAALRTGVPIFPVSIVGSEEIHPMLFNAKTLARALGLPYFPITPTFPWLGPLGLVPLPSKWHIEFGPPIATAGLGPDAADDPLLAFELTDRVRETIQATLYRLLAQRSSPWS